MASYDIIRINKNPGQGSFFGGRYQRSSFVFTILYIFSYFCQELLQNIFFVIYFGAVTKDYYMKNKLGRIIKERRGQLGLTQEELAKKLGIVRENISYYEQGKRNPPPRVAYKLSQILNLDVLILLDFPMRTDDLVEKKLQEVLTLLKKT